MHPAENLNPTSSDPKWSPFLWGLTLRLCPLNASDYDALFAAASDPLIWEHHPDRLRYTPERFARFFSSAMESSGPFAVVDSKSGKIIGTSRYNNLSLDHSSVEIGYTFLTRDFWGGVANRELKTLMLEYAFRQVETVYFVVAKENVRSQRALQKIGATLLADVRAVPSSKDLSQSMVYCILRQAWRDSHTAIEFSQPSLNTLRLQLEAITEAHAPALWELFQDSELHRFNPTDPFSLEEQHRRCARWAKRRSADGAELQLNWIAICAETSQTVGHFQVGISEAAVATVGYVVARQFQRRGIAGEALHAVFSYLEQWLGVKEIRALSDTRNIASHRLAEKLGIQQIGFLKDADFFKGATSDEFVFSKRNGA